MINRNIGNIERIVRLILAVVLIGWVATSNTLDIRHALATLAAAALLWNSVFGRCYLWKWLGVSSCDPDKEDCSAGNGGSRA